MKIPGLFQILVIALIILVLFGRGRISGMMGDFGQGIRNFRKNLGDDDEEAPARIDGRVVESATDKTAG